MGDQRSARGLADDQAERLCAAAVAVRENAYAPYSRFRVGAAVLCGDGSIHVGVNVENAAYPQGQCAEASALGAMAATGRRSAVAVAVAGGEPGDGVLCTPCGGCRQRLREFAAPDVPVYVCGPEGVRRVLTVGELLPFSFGPDNLSSSF